MLTNSSRFVSFFYNNNQSQTLNPTALGTAKTLWSFGHSERNRSFGHLWSFGHSECNRVKIYRYTFNGSSSAIHVLPLFQIGSILKRKNAPFGTKSIL